MSWYQLRFETVFETHQRGVWSAQQTPCSAQSISPSLQQDRWWGWTPSASCVYNAQHLPAGSGGKGGQTNESMFVCLCRRPTASSVLLSVSSSLHQTLNHLFFLYACTYFYHSEILLCGWIEYVCISIKMIDWIERLSNPNALDLLGLLWWRQPYYHFSLHPRWHILQLQQLKDVQLTWVYTLNCSGCRVWQALVFLE